MKIKQSTYKRFIIILAFILSHSYVWDLIYEIMDFSFLKALLYAFRFYSLCVYTITGICFTEDRNQLNSLLKYPWIRYIVDNICKCGFYLLKCFSRGCFSVTREDRQKYDKLSLESKLLYPAGAISILFLIFGIVVNGQEDILHYIEKILDGMVDLIGLFIIFWNVKDYRSDNTQNQKKDIGLI